MSAQLERRRDVEPERVFQDGDRHVSVCSELLDAAGVVHQNVQSAKSAHRLAYDVFETFDFGNVGWNRGGVAAHRPDLVGHRLDVAFGPGDERHVRARLGERERDALTDALAGTGDESGFSVEAELLGDICQRHTVIPKISAALPRQIWSTSFSGTPSNCFSIHSAENGNDPSWWG